MSSTNRRSLLAQFPALRTPVSVLEERRLSRFISKLLGEALHLGAESISIIAKDECLVRLWRDDRDMVVRRFDSAWFHKLVAHLIRSDLPMLANDRKAWTEIAPNMAAGKLTGAVRLPSQIVTFTMSLKCVDTQGVGCTLSGFRAYSPAVAMGEIGLSDDHRSLVDSIISSQPGLIIACAPEPAEVPDAIATALALSGGIFLGEVSGLDISEWSHAASSTLGVAGCVARDSVSALIAIRDAIGSIEKLSICGVFCQVLAPRNCLMCSIETTAQGELPVWFSEGAPLMSRIGKGCPACNQKGVKGYIGIQSVAQVDEEISDLLSAGAELQSLADLVTGRGSRPLVEDALRKLREGQISMQTARKLPFQAPDYKVRISSRRSMLPSFSAAEAFQFQPSGEVEPIGRLSPQELEGDLLGAGNESYSLLVVEDDPDQRSILEMVLRSANYDVALAGSGLQALEMLQTIKPDAIISDLMMPEMDGGELVAALKAHPEYSRIPVLVLTVVADAEREFQLLDLGADDYCEKTVQRKIFLKRVEHLVKRKNTASPA